MEDQNKDKKDAVIDVEIIQNNFKLGPMGEVPLESYLKGYAEMNNIFKIMGPLFSFVETEAEMKLSELRKFMEESGEHYVDVKTMLDYETSHKLLERRKPVAASRLFLHLHRALEFIISFMKEMMKEDDETNLGEAASQLYMTTMSKFHPPIVRQAFSDLLLLLPAERATLINKLTKGNEEEESRSRRLMPEAIKRMKETYDACQELYRTRNLLELETVWVKGDVQNPLEG